MATLHYIDYPRNFANEYSVFAVAPEDRTDFEAARPNAERISRREAIRKGWSRPREAKRDGEQWFGGFYEDMATQWAETLDQALENCRNATANLIEEYRSGQRYWAEGIMTSQP